MIKQITAAILMAATSFAATAAEPTQFYVGADVGATKVDHYDNENSFGIFAGYQFNQNIAIEAGYRKLGDFGGYYAPEVNQTAISLLASAPVANNLSVYGRVGYNRLEAKIGRAKAHDNNALFGVGLSYAFTKNVAARIEWQRPSSDSQNLSVGVAYAF